MRQGSPDDERFEGCAILMVQAAGMILAGGGICLWFYIVFVLNGGRLNGADIAAIAAMVGVLLAIGGMSSKK